MLDRAGLARQASPGHGGEHIELTFHVGHGKGLLQDHLQHRTREIGVDVLAVDHDLARPGLDPDAGDRVLALARRIGPAQLVPHRHAGRGFHRGGRRTHG